MLHQLCKDKLSLIHDATPSQLKTGRITHFTAQIDTRKIMIFLLTINNLYWLAKQKIASY
jgi:hypothetical protein